MPDYASRFGLHGKRALITGASKGIAAEIAAVLAGADVAIVGRDVAGLCLEIAPTVVLTDMGKQTWGDEAKAAPVKARIPLHRFGEPIEIADLALYLASPASDFICGQVMLIDGGYSAV